MSSWFMQARHQKEEQKQTTCSGSNEERLALLLADLADRKEQARQNKAAQDLARYGLLQTD